MNVTYTQMLQQRSVWYWTQLQIPKGTRLSSDQINTAARELIQIGKRNGNHRLSMDLYFVHNLFISDAKNVRL